MGRKRPLCYPELSVSVCMSVLTQSKSICHQDCHCGTKREGSLPGRTHSERNGERQDRHKEAWWSLGEVQVGFGNLHCPTYSYNSKHTCCDQEDQTSNSLINPFFFSLDMFVGCILLSTLQGFSEYCMQTAQKILLMRKSSHLLRWRDVLLDKSVGVNTPCRTVSSQNTD